jgi:hypothetical protein
VARLNIERFRRRIETETEEIELQVLLRLLSKEEARLKALKKPEKVGVRLRS